MRENKMKQILDEGKLAVGMGIFTGSPIVVQMIGYSGFDFVFIDMEHTPKNLLIRALHRKKPSAKKREKASKEVNAFCEQFGFAPTLWKLLQEEGGVNNE